MKIKSVEGSYADPETRQWLVDNFERHQKEGWHIWQEPWFRRRYPGYYAFFRLMARIGL